MNFADEMLRNCYNNVNWVNLCSRNFKKRDRLKNNHFVNQNLI